MLSTKPVARVRNGKLATEVFVYSFESGFRRREKLARHYPLFYSDLAACCFEDIKQTSPCEVTNSTFFVDSVDKQVAEQDIIFLSDPDKGLLLYGRDIEQARPRKVPDAALVRCSAYKEMVKQEFFWQRRLHNPFLS